MLSWLFLELAIAANDEAELTRAPEMSTPPALVSLYLSDPLGNAPRSNLATALMIVNTSSEMPSPVTSPPRSMRNNELSFLELL